MDIMLKFICIICAYRNAQHTFTERTVGTHYSVFLQSEQADCLKETGKH